MEEQDPDVVNAACILRSFGSKETEPKPKPKSPTKTTTSLPWAAGRGRIENETVQKSPPRKMSLPPAGRKKGRSAKRSRSCIGWIAAMDAANIVAQKTAEVLQAAQEAKENSGGRSSPDSPLDFLINSNGGGRSSPDSPLDFLLNSSVAADATVKKPRREEAESSATTEEKQTKNAQREEAERSATTEEKQKLQKDREEQLSRQKEKRLASSFRRRKLVLELLKTSAPTCAPSASIVVADGERTALLPSSSSSSSLQASRGDKFLFDLNSPTPLDDQSQGVKFLFDLNLPPPDDC